MVGREDNMNAELKSLVKNSGLNIAGSAVSRILKYVAVLFAVKALGVTDYGYYVLGLAVMEIGSIFGNMGFQYAVFRFVPMYRGKGDINRVKGTILFSFEAVLVFGVIVSIIIFCCSEWISTIIFKKPDLSVFIKVLAFALPFVTLSRIISNIFKGFNVIKYNVAIYEIIVVVLRTVLFLFCLLLGLGAFGILYSFLGSVFLGFLLGVYFVLRIFPKIRDNSIKAVCDKKEIVHFSFPLFLTGFLNVFLNKTDILMLSYYVPAGEIAIYSISQRVAHFVMFISFATFAVFTPAVAELFGKGKYGEMEDNLKKTIRWSLITTVPIYVVIVVFAEGLLSIFGKEFCGGDMVLYVLATGFLINSVIGFSGQMLAVKGRAKLILFNSIGAALVNVCLNLVMIPKFGMIGAALATGFSILAVNVARTFEIYFLDKLNALQMNLIRPLLIGAISGLLAMWVKSSLHFDLGLLRLTIIAICLFIVYGILTLFFALDKEEMRIARGYVNRVKEAFV